MVLMNTAPTTLITYVWPTVCPHNDPGCDIDRFPCLACMDDWDYARGITPPARFRQVAEEARWDGFGQRTGTGRSGSTFTRQGRDEVRWTKHNGEWALKGSRAILIEGATVTVTKKDGTTAEAVVGRTVMVPSHGDDTTIICLPAPKGAAQAATEPVEYRWTKVDGDWLVRGPQATEGDTITITKASGETAQATVTGVRADGLFTVRKVEAQAPGTTPVAELIPGSIHVNTNGEWVKVSLTRSGHLVGKVGTPGDWEYGGKAALRNLVRPITAEEAAEWGHLHENCCFCSRHLSDDGENRSMEVGYGPICADKYGLPWG